MEWLAIKSWLFGAFGSALGMFFSRKNVERFKTWEIFFIFISGVFIAHVVGGAIVEHFNVKVGSLIADSIKMTVGMSGMGVLARLHEIAPSLVDKWLKK